MTTSATERVDAFIDGLNLYQGIKQKGYQDSLWLDLRALCTQLLRPDQTLGTVYYFSAERTTPPESHVRQMRYWDALEAVGGVEIVRGRFDRRKAPCEHCGRMTEMPRERATDVQLASYMVHGAAAEHYDTAFLISGDSDYVETVRLIRGLGKKVKLIRPPARRSAQLSDVVDHFSDLNRAKLRKSQLPDPVMSGSRQISCPVEWLSMEHRIERLTATQRAAIETAINAVGPSNRHHLGPLVDEMLAQRAAAKSQA